MNLGQYFGIIINVLTVLVFIILVLAFVYMVYGREEKSE
jgi:cbb3-type cytochrome oxidase subunit 3